MGGSEVVAPLAKAMAVQNGTIAQLAARALGWTGQAAAESALITALDREDVRVVAAKALGYVGTVEAVLPLKEAEARYPRDKELRLAASQAVTDIQSRLSGASPGQLSLTDGEAGHLSLPEDDAGRLSLPEQEPPATRPVGKPV
jgi:HEAT repeat protein